MAILGESFKDYVTKQINVRQDKLSLQAKDDDTLRYITSKTSFLRLTSGIDISTAVAQNLGFSPSSGYNGHLLAKEYVLFSSQFDGNPTSGIGYRTGDTPSSYGFTSDINYGLVPPPGLISAETRTLNRGTIREATINLICHNLYQFKIINALFLKLKYSLLLEWGHTLYFTNGSKTDPTPVLITPKSLPNLSDDFLKGISPDEVLKQIEIQREKSGGNYDAFFGVVKNFNWELQENGSYSIVISAISQGDVIDSLKVNTNLTPDENITGDEPQYKKSTLHKILGDITKKIADGPGGPGGTYKGYLHGYKTADNEIALNSTNVANFTGLTANYKEPLDTDAVGKANAMLTNNEGIGITFPDLEMTETPNGSKTASPQFYIKLGTLLRIIESFLLYYDTSKKNENGSLSSIFYIDHNFDTNECLTTPRHISSDPLTCVIPLDFVNASGDTTAGTSVVYFYNQTETTYNITFLRDTDGTIIAGGTETPVTTTTTGLPDAPSDPNIVFGQETIVGASSSEIPTNVQLAAGIEIYRSIFGLITSSPGSSTTETVTITTRTYTREDKAIITNESQAGTLTYVEKSFRSGNPYIGKTMHIYVNIDKIIEVLDNNIDGNGDVPLQNFLSQLLGEISSALCCINKFDLDYDETTNRFSIIDTAVFPLKYKNTNNVAKFNINLLKTLDNGGGSFITNFGLKSEVFGQISNAIAIGAQAGGNNLFANSSPISKFNEGLTDRIMTTKTNSNAKVEDPNKGFYQFKEAYTRYEQFKIRVTNTSPGSGVTTNDISLYRSFLVDLMKFDIGTYTATNNIPGTGFIPLNLQLTMDGLSGIRQYQTFDIDETLLPNEYTNKLKFITTTVTHKIDTKGWETTVNSLGVPKNNQPAIVTDKDIPKIEAEVKTETVNITENKTSADKCGKANADTVNTVYPRSVKWQRGPDPVKVPAEKSPGYTINLSNQPEVAYIKTLKSYQEVIQAIEKVIDQLSPKASSANKKLIIASALAVSISEQGSGGAIKGFNNNLTGTEAPGFKVFNASDVNGKVSLKEGGTGKQKYYYSFATLEAGYVPLVSKILERNMFASSGDPNEFAWRYFRDWNGYGARTLPKYKSGEIDDCSIVAGKEKLYNKALEAVNTYSKYR